MISKEIQPEVPVELSLSPEGRVYVNRDDRLEERISLAECIRIEELFAQGSPYGILHIGLRDFASLPSTFMFWQTFSCEFIARVCRLQSLGAQAEVAIDVPNRHELQALLDRAPFMKGAEYLSEGILIKIWHQMEEVLNRELSAFTGSLQSYLAEHSPRWNQVGRVCFHLAENKTDDKKPFAFLATYTSLSSQSGRQQHLPLKRALHESATEGIERSALLSLLIPVQKAAAQSTLVKNLVDSGALFQPLAWTPQEAHQFLKDIPLMEESGVVIRVPNWWNAQKPPRLKAQLHLGERPKSMLGLNSLLEFDVQLAYADGKQMTREEYLKLLENEGGLVKVNGQWIEVDRDKLNVLLDHWDQLKATKRDGLSMAEGLRLLAGMDESNLSDTGQERSLEWFQVSAGGWLETVLQQLRSPDNPQGRAFEGAVKQKLRGTLRPYQAKGVQWLWMLYQLRLGGCLADDMGLGKTIQVLSLLLTIKEAGATDKPHLVVVPASLLGNWLAEAARFAPSLKIALVHSSTVQTVEGADLVLTTYGFLQRAQHLQQTKWNLVILDEAQAIKNPNAKQTLAVKNLTSDVRFALTGTPVENRFADLWSLFDFTSPGLLGSAKAFANHSKQTERTRFLAALRKLTQPYILRRLKNDKNIVSDLPEKTELKVYCHLSKAQICMYAQAVEELTEKLQAVESIQRKGLVLSTLMRLKQICNHPSQASGLGEYAEAESGKWIRLGQICEGIIEKQEKVLVFTQFKEIIDPLSSYLANLFGREGLSLHGGIPVSKRAALVEEFQKDQGPPFFLLSLKAGGTGLNLTKASHVIHFDRWWNPAVENQATDRAYRIGQKRNVLVHQFVCQGTIEEKVDALIESKKKLSQELLEDGRALSLTELSNDEMLQMVSLDIKQAMEEE